MFAENLSVLALETRFLLYWVLIVDVSATKSIYEIMKKTADTRIKPSEKTIFPRSPD